MAGGLYAVDSTYNNHGTACAGIIAAERNNEIGISGVAPKAKIMSISIDLTNQHHNK